MEAIDGIPVASSSRLTLDSLPAVTASAPAPSRGKKRAKIEDQDESVVPKKKQKSAVEGVKVKASRGRNHTRPRPPPQVVHVEPIVPVLKPKWKLLPAPVANPGESNGVGSSDTFEKRPRIWTSCRDEFFAILPEASNAKFVHDVSWHLHETPMILLDHASPSFSVLKTADMDLISLDIVSHRQFSCDDPAPSSISTAPSTKRGRGGKRGQGSRLVSGPLATLAQPSVELKPFGMTAMSFPTGSDRNLPAEPEATLMAAEPATQSIGVANPTSLNDLTKTVPFVSVDVAHSTSTGQTSAESPARATGARLKRTRKESAKMKRAEQEEQDVVVLASLPAHADSQPPPPTPKKRKVRPPKAKAIPSDVFLGDPQLPKTAGGTSGLPPLSDAPLPSTDPFASMIPFDPPAEAPIAQEPLPSATGQLPLFLFPTFGPDMDGFVPPLPDEIKAIVDAYLCGKPVAVYATNECARLHWAPLVPQEFGCMLMGWFRVVGVQEQRVLLPDGTLTKVEGGSIHGCVSWRFRLRWAPGGEEHMLKKTPLRVLERPWWIPSPPLAPDSKSVEGSRDEDEEDERYSSPLSSPPSSLKSLLNDLAPSPSAVVASTPHSPEPPQLLRVESSPTSDLVFPLPFQSSIQPRPLIFEEVEETFPTTPKYRAERVANPNYQYRHYHLREMYYSALPAGIAGIAPGAADSSSELGTDESLGDERFPRGWVCARCGRLCWQGTLRGRKCVSSFCKNEPLVAPRCAVDVVSLREGVHKLPMILPQDRVPSGVKTEQRDDKDHMVTLSYYFNIPLEVIAGVTTKGSYVKHIFTRNWHVLAKEATELLRLIQSEVDLERDWKDPNNLYFTHTARCPESQLQVGFDPSTSPWKDVAAPINNGRAWMTRQARHYAQVEKKELFIDRVELVAWVKPGQGKGPLTFRAREKCVVILCMGFHVGLTLFPHSGIKKPSLEEDLVSQLDATRLRPTGGIEHDVDVGEVVEGRGGGWIAAAHAESGMDVDMPLAVDPASTLQTDVGANEPTQGRVKRAAAGRNERSEEEIYVELVHGDILVLYGDDFDCHLRRDGMSILMVASHDPSAVIPHDPFPFAHLPPIPLQDDEAET